MDKLSKKIALEKLAADAAFNLAELAEIKSSPALTSDMKLNMLLANEAERANKHLHAVPSRPTMLDAAKKRAKNERSYYKRRAVMLAVRRSWPVAATVLVAVIVLVIVTTFFRPQSIAWASTDGYVIECMLNFERYFSGTLEDPPGHKVLQLERLVEEWAEGTGSQGNATVELKNHHGQPGVYTIGITIRLQDYKEEDVNALLAQIEGWDAVWGAFLFSETWHYSQKFPDTFFPGRQIIINGEGNSFPQDFNQAELDDLRPYMRYFSDLKGIVYVPFLTIDQAQRFKLADLVTITMGPGRELIIADYGPLDARLHGLMPKWRPGLSVYVTEFELDEDFEPEELVEAAMKSAQTRLESKRDRYFQGSLYGHRLVFDLPEGNPTAAIWTAASLNDIALEWAQAYPGLVPKGDFRDVLRFKFVPSEAYPRQYVVDLWYVQSLFGSLKAAYDEQGFAAARSFSIVPSQQDILQAQFQRDQLDAAKGPRLDLLLKYELVDLSDEHGTDTTWAIENLSETEIQQSTKLAMEIEAAFEKWQAGYIEEHGALDDLVRFQATKAFGTEAYTHVYANTAFDGEELEAFIQAIHVPGAPEPIRVPQQYRGSNRPVGMRIRCQYLPTSRFRDVLPDDARAQITEEELAQFAGNQEMVQQVFDSWTLENKGAEFGSEAAGHAELFLRKFGDVPIGFLVTTSFAPGTELDALMKLVTPPEFFIFEAFEPFNYDVGPKTVERTSTSTSTFTLGFYDDQVLWYSLLPHQELSGMVYDSLTELFDPALRTKQGEVLEKMQAALASWNHDNPPDPAKDESPATLEFYENDGLVQEVSIKCTRTSREAMESLAEALAVPGAPVYQYGISFLNRHVPDLQQPGHRKKEVETETLFGASVQYNLIPQIYWGKELEYKVTEERKAWSIETAHELTEIFNLWLDKHPGLESKFDEYSRNWLKKTHAFSANEVQGKVREVRLQIYTPVEGEAQALAEELIEEFSVVEGLVSPHKRFGLEREFPVNK